MSDGVATHDCVLALLADEAVLAPIVCSAVGMIDHETGKREQCSASGEVKHAVEVDPLSGNLPCLATIRDLDTSVDDCLLELPEVFTGHSDECCGPAQGLRTWRQQPSVKRTPKSLLVLSRGPNLGSCQVFQAMESWGAA